MMKIANTGDDDGSDKDKDADGGVLDTVGGFGEGLVEGG